MFLRFWLHLGVSVISSKTNVEQHSKNKQPYKTSSTPHQKRRKVIPKVISPLSFLKNNRKTHQINRTQHNMSELAPKQPKNKTKPRKQAQLNATQQTLIIITSPPETKNAKRRQTNYQAKTSGQKPINTTCYTSQKETASELKPRQLEIKTARLKTQNKRKQPDPTTAPIQEHNSTPRPKKSATRTNEIRRTYIKHTFNHIVT